MHDAEQTNLDYDHPIEIAEGIHWVGFYDESSGLHCNPYLIVDGDEAVVIDGGSRPDFPTVMMKILQVGISPSSISTLIYQHYDPDLCGSIPNLEDIIDRDDLKLLTERYNIPFIRHYSVSSPIVSIDTIDNQFTFSSGRKLTFIRTPFAHSAGSFITFDEKTGVLFTSDIFGRYSKIWNIFETLAPECEQCTTYSMCPVGKQFCSLRYIIKFQEQVMTSNKALRNALDRIKAIPFSMIAPQHGSIFTRQEDISIIIRKLYALTTVGIDGINEDQG